MDKFENKIVDMRDLYQDRKERIQDGGQTGNGEKEAEMTVEGERVIVVRNGVVVCV